MVNWYRRGQVLPTRHRLYQKARTHRSQQSILLQLFFATQVLHLRVRNLGLACKIGTFLGPNLDFGPIWDQVPNLGLHYSACTGCWDYRLHRGETTTINKYRMASSKQMFHEYHRWWKLRCSKKWKCAHFGSNSSQLRKYAEHRSPSHAS